MTMTDPERLGPQDFDECFRGEPEVPDAGADLARGRRRRTRRTAAAVSGVTTAVAFVAVLGLTLSGPSTQTAVPAAPSPAPSVHVSSPFPSWTVPAGPGPSAGPPSSPLDTYPVLRYTKTQGYVDQDGHVRTMGSRVPAFSATTKNTYDLVRRHLDRDGDHLGAYQRDAFTGGSGTGGAEIGQKLSWKVDGEAGEGMLLVSVTRLPPGAKPVTKGDDRDGLCAGSFVEARCTPATVDGHQVFLDRQPGGGFVVDYVQPDGEVASAWVDPLFGNNTDVPLKQMGVSLSAVLDLLTDPDLDVVG